MAMEIQVMPPIPFFRSSFSLYATISIPNEYENAMHRALPFLKHTIKSMANHDVFFDSCFTMADLGCSTGMNTLLVASNVIDIVHEVPKGLESNKLNIYISKTSTLNVLQAYGKQFHTDFTKFLQLRSEEIVRDGRMVLTLPGRSKVDPSSDECWRLWDLLTISLLELLEEALVQESDLNSFNLPFYLPCEDELWNIIQNDGSFSLDNMNVYEVNWDPHDTNYTTTNDLNVERGHNHAKNETKKSTTKLIRAIAEPLLSSHFGSSIIDVLFKKYEKHVAKHLAVNKTKQFTIVISLTKKL
ncbi:benzoate carboxyl methyltransferase-like [Bidens hawaiensis]|uniref:benzoate carboxyl methyltransferase-like n=1 Tax=Bidens hawaiensis TaxID=980011 RepID=UPI004049FB9A